MKYLNLIIIFLLLSLTGCKLADLRTDSVKNNLMELKGRTLLQKMGVAHGIAQWKNIETYSVKFSEEFYGRIGKSGNPFPEQKTTFLLQYITNSFDGQMKFLSGKKKDEIWGLQSWEAYTIIDNLLKFKKNKDISFWLPTYQYFIEFPLRIQQATAVSYAGEKEVNGVSCVGILASWGSIEPQKETDQYLIWIDKESHRIVKLEYTIREYFGFLKGAAFFKDYKSYDGLYLPSSFPVESNLVKDGILHQMQILDFIANPIKKEILRPKGELPVTGNNKAE